MSPLRCITHILLYIHADFLISFRQSAKLCSGPQPARTPTKPGRRHPFALIFQTLVYFIGMKSNVHPAPDWRDLAFPYKQLASLSVCELNLSAPEPAHLASLRKKKPGVCLKLITEQISRNNMHYLSAGVAVLFPLIHLEFGHFE